MVSVGDSSAHVSYEVVIGMGIHGAVKEKYLRPAVTNSACDHGVGNTGGFHRPDQKHLRPKRVGAGTSTQTHLRH